MPCADFIQLPFSVFRIPEVKPSFVDGLDMFRGIVVRAVVVEAHIELKGRWGEVLAVGVIRRPLVLFVAVFAQIKARLFQGRNGWIDPLLKYN